MQFLPAQGALAEKFGFNPQVYATEALGLAFAFGDENGSMGFATKFGPTNPAMPNSTAGDAATGSDAPSSAAHSVEAGLSVIP